MQSGKPWVSGNLSSYTSLATAAENESEQAGFVLSILDFFSDVNSFLHEHFLPSGNNNRAAIYQVLTRHQALTWVLYKYFLI